jgi:LDH2 family malate/lactate/ureidoglycolate dehydrogenase
MTERYNPDDLIECTADLFAAAGLDAPIARVVAEILVEAELLGYDTHGLQFIPAYIAGIEGGGTECQGEPSILKDGGNTLLLDARGLPGQWATVKALEWALERLPAHGTVTAVLRHCGNISCLATYAKRAADRGAMAIVATSAPGNGVVAPPGGREGRVSTNPMAVAIPMNGSPLLIDTSTASVSNRQVERARRAGKRLPDAMLIDVDGRPSDDPETLLGEPKGAILPVGGMALGHKGFAFSILVEALTTSHAGVGRAGPERAAGSNTFLMLIDPGAFGGGDAFRDEAGALAAWCRSAAPVDPERPVRMPGDRAARHWAEQMANGVRLHEEVPGLYTPVFERYGIKPPKPIKH